MHDHSVTVPCSTDSPMHDHSTVTVTVLPSHCGHTVALKHCINRVWGPRLHTFWFTTMRFGTLVHNTFLIVSSACALLLYSGVHSSFSPHCCDEIIPSIPSPCTHLCSTPPTAVWNVTSQSICLALVVSTNISHSAASLPRCFLSLLVSSRSAQKKTSQKLIHVEPLSTSEDEEQLSNRLFKQKELHETTTNLYISQHADIRSSQ